jgi:hypothetical protein
MLKTAVTAPIPSARITMEEKVKLGDLESRRKA